MHHPLHVRLGVVRLMRSLWYQEALAGPGIAIELPSIVVIFAGLTLPRRKPSLLGYGTTGKTLGPQR